MLYVISAILFVGGVATIYAAFVVAVEDGWWRR